MEPGDLRELVTIQHKLEAPAGDRGQAKYTWVTFLAGVPAAFVEYKGEKAVVGPQLVGVGDCVVVTRYIQGVTDKMRVVDSLGQVYNIQAILRGDGEERYFWTRLHVRPQSGGIT